jgi:type II secretory pathway component GspD/PulD (secretin)
MKTYHLKKASAQEVAQKLQQFYAGSDKTMRITFDQSSNTVFVQADPATQTEAAKLVKLIDPEATPGTESGKGPTPGGPGLGRPGGPRGGGGGGTSSSGSTTGSSGTSSSTGTTGGGSSSTTGTTDGNPQPLVTELKHAKAHELAMVLAQVFGDDRAGLRITHDNRTNTLIVSASAADLELIKKLIDRLDAPAPETKSKR